THQRDVLERLDVVLVVVVGAVGGEVHVVAVHRGRAVDREVPDLELDQELARDQHAAGAGQEGEREARQKPSQVLEHGLSLGSARTWYDTPAVALTNFRDTSPSTTICISP